ncbi:hypothetical protein O181_083399 [Austropuccinia psidii MF-1]|uniref:Uncharacterized protein n=1 Tax=Austropuccinia psidii MF-1 TaxID=1389203 RepID=A0A9Q3ILT1_9BASI|nr:hypothetical protein [Austropuccinia psidii MF-1]
MFIQLQLSNHQRFTQPLCVNGNVVAYLNPFGGVAIGGQDGLSSAFGICNCMDAADGYEYLACDEDSWPNLNNSDPNIPVLCATNYSAAGVIACPSAPSLSYQALIQNYNLKKAGRITSQQVAVCKDGALLGRLEGGTFLRNAGALNTIFPPEQGCTCVNASNGTAGNFTCNPWPTSLSKFSPQTFSCYNSLFCPSSNSSDS